MARPQLAIGSLGRISTSVIGKRRVRARARYRDVTGRTRQMEATGSSAMNARTLLEQKFATRVASAGEMIGPDMRVGALAEVWLVEVGQSTRTPQTMAMYRRNVERFVKPGIGGLALWEATTGQLDRFLKAVAAETPGQAKTTKTVLGQMFSLAARHDAVKVNPVRDTRLPERRRSTVRAMTVEEVQALRRGLHAYLNEPVRSGPGRPQDLGDLVDIALGTGMRVGELLGLRWEDVALGGCPRHRHRGGHRGADSGRAGAPGPPQDGHGASDDHTAPVRGGGATEEVRARPPERPGPGVPVVHGHAA